MTPSRVIYSLFVPSPLPPGPFSASFPACRAACVLLKRCRLQPMLRTTSACAAWTLLPLVLVLPLVALRPPFHCPSEQPHCAGDCQQH